MQMPFKRATGIVNRTIVECKLFNTVPEDEEIRDKIIPDILSISGNSVDTEYIEMIFQSD